MRIITGRWKGHRIRVPGGRDVRPTGDRVKEAWMSMLGGRIVHARVLDLFAGSGSLGLECLSRGAREVVFVERSGRVLDVLRANVERLGADEGEIRIVRGDAVAFVDALPRFGEGSEDFDLVLADPPYRSGLAAGLLERFNARPFAGELWVEHDSREIVPAQDGIESRRYGDTTLSWTEAP